MLIASITFFLFHLTLWAILLCILVPLYFFLKVLFRDIVKNDGKNIESKMEGFIIKSKGNQKTNDIEKDMALKGEKEDIEPIWFAKPNQKNMEKTDEEINESTIENKETEVEQKIIYLDKQSPFIMESSELNTVKQEIPLQKAE